MSVREILRLRDEDQNAGGHSGRGAAFYQRRVASDIAAFAD